MVIRALCLQLAFVLAVIAQDKVSLRVDEILKQWNKPDSPGAAVAVIRNGELMFQKGMELPTSNIGFQLRRRRCSTSPPSQNSSPP
jgi:hypothetical protein